MNKMIIFITVVLLSFLAPVAASLVHANNDNEGVCSGTHLSANQQTTFTYTAPEGQLISGYCVKAGSINQGNGPEYHEVDPPQESITFSHSSGKEISHFSVILVDKPVETTTTIPETTLPETTVVETTVPETTTTTVVVETTSTTVPEVVTTTTEPVTTTTEPVTTTSTEAPVVETTTTVANVVVEETTTPPVQPFVAPEELPATGGETGVIAIFAGLLILLGVGLVLIRKYVNS